MSSRPLRRLPSMAHAQLALHRGGRVIELGRVEAGDRCDLSFLDHLLQLQVAVRRFGWNLRVDGASPELQELVELVGLDDHLS